MIASLAFVLALATPVGYAPQARYDAGVPTLEQVVGHAPGARISSPEQVVAYLRAVNAAAPDRTRLVEYGRTWEGRPLVLMILGRPDRLARLDAVKADLRKLADPRGVAEAEIDRLVRELPVVVWLMHAVHGNEISSSDAALAEVYHLLAAQDDPAAELVRREALVVVDPLQNPDGRARFLAQNALGAAAEPDPEPASIEHEEPWPGGRGNHYLFDMNRDWFAQTQVETTARIRALLDLPPHVSVDLHEMGGDSTYYFAPPAEPLNPHIAKSQNEWLDRFGRHLAARFDERGFPYFVRETYDAFYPGYGESWPTFQGAIGMTFEQASARGLLYRRRDDTLLTYAQGVLQHMTAALATAETAARERERILRDYVREKRASLSSSRTYVLLPGEDPARAARLARLLLTQGLDVRRAEESFDVAGRRVPAGAWLVPAAQPAGALVRTLLEPEVPLEASFLAEQDRRRRRRVPDEIYDVTAWSLPMLFDVEQLVAEKPLAVRTTAATTAPSPAAVAPAKVAWILPWGSGTASAVGELLRRGVKVQSAGDWLQAGGRRYEAGTAIVRVQDNPPDVAGVLREVAARHEVPVVALDSGWTDAGISLGSSSVRPLKAPRVLLLWDQPAWSLSAGWARWVLERRFGQPVTAVRARSLGRVDLRRYDVIVMPSGDYGDTLGGELNRVREWLRAGGVLVTLGEATRWAARERQGLLSTRTELRGGAPDKDAPPDKKDEKSDKPFDLEKAIEPDRERPHATPGALLRVGLDREHWLAAGTDGEIQAVVEGDRVLTPIKLDAGRNVGVYAKKDRLVASGLVWPEAREQLAQKAFLVDQPYGDGHVVAFAEDPNFRGYAETTELLLMNAILLGPAF